MPRNKSQRQLDTESDLRRKIRVYAEAVEWFEMQLREAKAELWVHDGAVAVASNGRQPISPDSVTFIRQDNTLGSLSRPSIPAPPAVITSVEDAPYDLYL